MFLLQTSQCFYFPNGLSNLAPSGERGTMDSLLGTSLSLSVCLLSVSPRKEKKKKKKEKLAIQNLYMK